MGNRGSNVGKPIKEQRAYGVTQTFFFLDGGFEEDVL